MISKAIRLHVPGGGALSVVPGKYLPEEVHIKPWEHARNQLWHAEANNDDFGFRNASTRKLLGVNKNVDIACVASQLSDWERFKFEVATRAPYSMLSLRDISSTFTGWPSETLFKPPIITSAIQLEVQQE